MQLSPRPSWLACDELENFKLFEDVVHKALAHVDVSRDLARIVQVARLSTMLKIEECNEYVDLAFCTR